MALFQSQRSQRIAQLQGILSDLEAVRPAPEPVSVYPVGELDPPGAALAVRDAKGTWSLYFVVDDTTELELIDTVLHEWAHIHTVCDGCESHGPEWGANYADIYSAFYAHRGWP